MLKLNWQLPAGVAATVTTVEQPGNLAAHVNADPAQVIRHRRQLMQQMSLPSAPRWLRQVHGAHVVTFSQARPTQVADAIYSAQPSSVCAVLTADCLPILLCSNDGSEIAAVHAGWRGLVNGVIEKTLEHFHHNAKEIRAYIGPAISQAAFEVGLDVYKAFNSLELVDSETFHPHLENKWMANLPLMAQRLLHRAGCTDVTLSNLCTYSDSRFYSYRKDPSCGRIATLIWKK